MQLSGIVIEEIEEMRVSTFSVAALAATAVPCVAFAPGTVGVREHTSLEMTTVGDALKVNGGSTDPPSEGTTDGDGGGLVNPMLFVWHAQL